MVDPRNNEATTRVRRPDEEGAVLVEFALVLPVLLAFLLGTITVGTAYDASISLNNAARESARYGAVRPVEADLSGWLDVVADVAVNSATGELDSGVAGQFVCVAYVYPDGTDAEDRTVRVVEQAGSRQVQTGQSCFSDGRPSDERRVQVQLQRDTNDRGRAVLPDDHAQRQLGVTLRTVHGVSVGGGERRDERGATIVMVAFMLVALTAIAATVVDLAAARADRASNQTAADAAATAAADILERRPAVTVPVSTAVGLPRGRVRADHCWNRLRSCSPASCDAAPRTPSWPKELGRCR